MFVSSPITGRHLQQQPRTSHRLSPAADVWI
jgi:hypothetical protein